MRGRNWGTRRCWRGVYGRGGRAWGSSLDRRVGTRKQHLGYDLVENGETQGSGNVQNILINVTYTWSIAIVVFFISGSRLVLWWWTEDTDLAESVVYWWRWIRWTDASCWTRTHSVLCVHFDFRADRFLTFGLSVSGFYSLPFSHVSVSHMPAETKLSASASTVPIYTIGVFYISDKHFLLFSFLEIAKLSFLVQVFFTFLFKRTFQS